ncbi:MAG: Zn-ribbon domain-containing OB-fold protein [Actinobacteria bacterium]|nr:Zn-ribbon domain-containing OB-fold protein [Actinomycetota bacterium]
MTDTRRDARARPEGAPPAELAVLTPDSWTQPFWVAAAEHRLVVPRCTNCGTFRMPPSPFCHVCQAQGIEWVEQAGDGRVYSYTVIHHAVVPLMRDALPYVVVVVELPDAGGVRLVSNLVDCDPSTVEIGMPVRLVWDDVADDVAVPRFTAAR